MNGRKKKWLRYLIKIAIAIVFFLIGMNFSHSLFFDAKPLFGVPYLGEITISLLFAMFGFFIVPTYFIIIKDWVAEIISRMIESLVGDFWAQYMSRMEESREERKKEQSKKKKAEVGEKVKGGILLDTSVLIDGRILEVAKTGFLLAPIVIPKFVVDELHLLADNKNDLKRRKGRRGLDMVNSLKKVCNVVVPNSNSGSGGVDAGLVKLAKDYKLKIMTLDFNLNKVAKVSNIKVLNLNDLVEALKPNYLPGEELTIEIVQRGKEVGQGVGYLPDGTMVVVDGGAQRVGKIVDVTVSKLIQTSAGKMIFTEVKVNK
jgi:uncharacterized protein YacL